MFRAAILALLASVVAANSFTPSGDVAATSRLGKRLLAKATVVEPARFLANNQDYSYLADYSLRYNGCLTLIQVAQNGQNNNKNNNGNLLYNQNLVRFGLCPTGSCSAGCTGGGEYVVDLGTFVDLYTEAKLTEQELICENIRESCDCENANDDQACEEACYTSAGQDACIEYDGQDDFEIQRYLQCQQIEGGNNNNNNNNNEQYGNIGEYDASTYAGPYYVAPYCSPKDGKSIYLGVFYDATCTAKADNGAYETAIGTELPYASKSLVATECIDCVNANNNDNNNNGNVEIKEFCTNNYAGAAKCETNLSGATYKDLSGCDYINNILPKLESVSRNSGKISASSGGSGKGAKAFAGIFAFTTVLFAAYSYFLYRKIKRGSVALASQ